MIGTIAYDNLGRRTSLTLGNGVATNYTYDSVSRLDELKLEFAGTTDDLTSEFTYSPASQIASNIRSNDAYSWTSHGSGTTSTTSNGLNQIASWVSTLGYDSKGNVTGDGTYTYGYSSENLLTSLANTASGAIQTSSTYAYDPLMRLAVINSSNDALDADLGYDGQNFILEGLSGSRTRRYVRGPGVDEPLVAYLVTSTGTSRLWYQADERGSIARLTNDSGTPGGIGKFDEYGVGGTGRIRYAGQYWLADGSLTYSRARIYDARLGRFLQPDPIGYGGGMNMYAYVGGDPINLVDPSGLQADVIEPDIVVTGKHPAIPYFLGGGYTDPYANTNWQGFFLAAIISSDGGASIGPVECKLGNGAIDVSFDGTTLSITTTINLVGPGADTSSAYIAGIGTAWTKSFGHINSIANISAGPGGLTAHVSSEAVPPGGPRAALGGNEMWLGNLGPMSNPLRAFAIDHVAPHEFGHPLGINNMPVKGKWAESIMANSVNNVSATDLEEVVELCRAAE